ncbi:hypothetical protein PM082_023153 [Marasmius tenuissimus]|nr:hypothetical protein PM082_023153 [Marasmius tenuissimus]
MCGSGLDNWADGCVFVAYMSATSSFWVELSTDPSLFNFLQNIITRDLKPIATYLFIDVLICRAILAQVGPGGSLGIAGLELRRRTGRVEDVVSGGPCKYLDHCNE